MAIDRFSIYSSTKEFSRQSHLQMSDIHNSLVNQSVGVNQVGPLAAGKKATWIIVNLVRSEDVL